MFKSVYVIPKYNAETDPHVVMIVEAIKRTAEACRLFILNDANRCTTGTLIVAVGGDGTMLGAMRIAAKHNSVAMGVNLGRIGFLTDFAGYHDSDAVEALFSDIFEYSHVIYPVEARLMIRAWSGTESVVAGNEISVSRDKSDSMITYRLILDDTDSGVYRANSLLVSTPSGSTAYSLSAGGALMMPAIQAMQVVPVAALTMTARPIVISHDTSVEIQAWGGKMTARSDGLEWVNSDKEYTKEDPFTVFVKHAGTVSILHNKDWNYFDMLTQKLGWIKE
ncbi:NAD(+)/NADH kinase [Candidatus Thorarchaeota archaeon]|nr:MAG: NAD(+)/NADH kinase [Candidatus Thorarchaeota archaeon]